MASGGSPSDIAVNMEGHPGEGTTIATTTTPPPSSAPIPIPSTSTTSTPHQEGDAVAATKEQHLGAAATAPKESLAVEKAGKEKGHKRTSSADLKFVAKVLKPSLKKNLSDAPISKELSERARSAPLIKKFNLPATETLLNDYSAALLKHILIHGRMYVSQNYICFESKIFGIKTMEVIPFKDITVLTKKSKKLNFARGIEIATPSQTYYFASFVSRVRAFALLTQIWRQHVPKDDQQPDDDDDDEDDEDAPDYESDDSALKKTKKIVKENSDVNLKLGRSVECPPPEQLKELQEKGLRRFSSPLLSRVVGSSNNNKNATASALATSSTTLLDLPPEPDHNALAASAPVAITSSTASGSTSSIPEPASAPPSAPPSDDEDEGDYDEGDGFLGAEAVYQQVLNTTFNINVKSFFKLFFSDDSTFTQTYRGHRGDKDITVKKWTNSPQFGMIRDVLFMSPVKVPLGPSHTRATETQRYHLSKNRLLIDTVTMFLDIPYGDSFRIEGKWDVSPASPDSCRLVISIGVHFMKKTWFKSKIESQTIKETKESFQQWATVAQAEITKALKSGSHLLHPSTHPPSQPNSQPPSAQSSPLLATHATPTAARASPPQSQQPAPEAEPTGPSPSSPHVSTTSASPRNRRRSVAGGSGVAQEKEGRFAILINTLTSLTNSSVLEGHNLVTVLMVVVLGVVFLNMYLRIVHLEGKVETLENILQPLLAKQVTGQL